MASNDSPSLNKQQTGDVPDEKPQNCASKDCQNDDELNALIDSALNDFETQAKTEIPKEVSSPSSASSSANCSSKEVIDDAFASSVESDFQKLDHMFAPLINADPQLKDHWEKLTQSCSDAANASNDEAFEESLRETLKTISEKAQAVAGDESHFSEEELAKIWTNLGIDESGDESANGGNPFANLMPLMTNMMQNLLSKELLYPALKDLSEKYPDWIDTHKDNLSDEDLKRYTTQLELMRNVCHEFDSEKDDESPTVKSERFQRILGIMQHMQQCGSPPNDLIGDVPDFGSAVPNDFKFPDFGSDGGGQNPQCRIM